MVCVSRKTPLTNDADDLAIGKIKYKPESWRDGGFGAYFAHS